MKNHPPRHRAALLSLPLLVWALACGERSPAPGAGPAAGGGGSGAAAATGKEKLSRIDALRSLPYLDFASETATPDEGGVTLHDDARAYPGYNLYTLRAQCAAELIDMSGRLVNRWQVSPCDEWQRAVLLPNGDLLAIGRSRRTRFLLRFDFDGDLLWRRELPTHHDVELTPSGDILAITLHPRDELIDGGVMSIRDDHFTLVDPGGAEVLASVSLYDAFRRAEARTGRRLLETVHAVQGDTKDFFHTNSVEWMDQRHLFGTHPLYDARHVLVSIKHQDLVAILDWDERALVWWWGRGELDGQHDATLLDNGNILLYDNGLLRGWGRALELDPRSGQIVWQYVASPPEELYTRGLGSARRLPNGNTLIGESERAHAFEVTRDGEVVWDFLVPHVNEEGRRVNFVRIVRHDKEAIEDLLRARRRRQRDAAAAR